MKVLHGSIAVAIAALLMVAGCKATVRTGGGPGPGPVVVVVTWPMADPLTGEVPVGRWACIDGSPSFDRIADSNRSRAPDVCQVLSNVGHSYVVELRPDGSGDTLTRYVRPQS